MLFTPAKHHPPHSPLLSFRAQRGISCPPLGSFLLHRLAPAIPPMQRFFAPPFGFALNDGLYAPFSAPSSTFGYVFTPAKGFTSMPSRAGLSPFYPLIPLTFGRAPAPAKHHPPRSILLSFRAQRGISCPPLGLSAPHLLRPGAPADAKVLRSALRLSRQKGFSPFPI